MRNNTNKTSILYVNFAPYDNAGKILDFIISKFDRVILFSFNFHRLSKSQPPSTLSIYENKKIIDKIRLFQTPTSIAFAFILLPLRSFVIFLQIIWHTWNLTQKYGVFDYYFTVNAFTAWTGNVIRLLGLVRKTVFWVWDYYPPIHESKMVMFMRWLYWLFDKPASIESDRVVFLNRHLKELRQDMGILPKKGIFPIVEIGTNPITEPSPHRKSETIHLVFLGVLKKIQGLDLFFDASDRIYSLYPDLILDIIGGGPDEEYFKNRAQSCNLKVLFHGYKQNETDVDKIIKKCHIGIAPYIPDQSNVMYYSDPSKIKRYLSFGLPIITTNVFDFSKSIQKERAGIIINYKAISFYRSINTIMKDYKTYQRNACNISKKYYYTDIYNNIFK